MGTFIPAKYAWLIPVYADTGKPLEDSKDAPMVTIIKVHAEDAPEYFEKYLQYGLRYVPIYCGISDKTVVYETKRSKGEPKG